MKRFTATTLALPAVLCGCGTTGPQPTEQPSVLITNNSCEIGRCMTLEIRAFVWAFTVPQPKFGSRVLGYARPGETCMNFPDSWSLRVIGPDESGIVDTTMYLWKPDSPTGIYLVGVDSLGLYGPRTQGHADSMNQAVFPFNGIGPSVGETTTFVPGEAPGWRAAFPSTPPFGGQIARTNRC